MGKITSYFKISRWMAKLAIRSTKNTYVVATPTRYMYFFRQVARSRFKVCSSKEPCSVLLETTQKETPM